MRVASTARKPRSRPVWAMLVALVRVLTMLLSLQFCGAIHDFSDALRSLATADQLDHEQCPPDGPCDDCPPGCPNCHCANAPTAVIPEAVRAELIALAVVPSSTPRVVERAP